MEEITQIILSNESFIYSIANKFTKYKNKEDLFQAGCIGMIEAYKNFDSSRGVKFTSYAYQYIYGEMSKFVREDHNLKLSREMSSLKNKVEKAKAYLTQSLMHVPSNKEISDYLEVDELIIEQILSYNDPFSMDEVFVDNLSLHDVLADTSYNDLDYDTLITLKDEIENLNEPERTIMIKRYYADLTQSEIASNLGLSQVDISRKEKKALIKLKKIFN